MNKSTEIIVQELAKRFPDTKHFRKGVIVDMAKEFGYSGRDFYPLIQAENRVKIGTYDLSPMLDIIKPMAPAANVTPINTAVAQMVQSVVNEEKSFAKQDPTFVPWGAYHDIVKIIKSDMFYPVYISGLSGNGKTFMVEQAAAKLGREFIRVQINPETDEDDLLGGFRLINGETVFCKGPVLKAMENGAVLLLDEIDRATNKIMCLQGVLEGKPILIKKTGEMIEPKPGFNIIATANTKGQGSDDGRFIAATIIDEAFLERFTITVEQPYPSVNVEKKILIQHMNKYNVEGQSDFADLLVQWSETIRKTYEDGGIEEVISTRRLCHIIQSFSIFEDRMKAIELCVSRFDTDTKEAFLDLYTKVDASVGEIAEESNVDIDDIINTAIEEA